MVTSVCRKPGTRNSLLCVGRAALLFLLGKASQTERHFPCFDLDGLAEAGWSDDQLPQITASLLSRQVHLQGGVWKGGKKP